jgi:hypothetical protein
MFFSSHDKTVKLKTSCADSDGAADDLGLFWIPPLDTDDVELDSLESQELSPRTSTRRYSTAESTPPPGRQRALDQRGPPWGLSDKPLGRLSGDEMELFSDECEEETAAGPDYGRATKMLHDTALCEPSPEAFSGPMGDDLGLFTEEPDPEAKAQLTGEFVEAEGAGGPMATQAFV